jgi:hypothetical protein
MIAYYAQPNRFHPFLLKIIKKKYTNFAAVFSHFIVDNKQYAFHLSNHQIEEINMEKILRVKTSDFFSGVLHPMYNKILKPTFSFTIISEPVNRVYQLYYIFKFLEREYKETSFIADLFKTKNLTMELFVDSLLENDYHKSVIQEHIFFIPKEAELLDFIGVAEESKKTATILGQKLNIDLNDFDFTERIDRCVYRIEDIRNSLEKTIQRYERIRTRLIDL